MKKQFLLLTLMLSVASTVFAEKVQIDGIWYYLSETTAEVIKSSDSYVGDIVIPSTVTYNGTDYSVTRIGGSAFAYCSSLTSITIPNSVTSIGDVAFEGCSSLTSITIPNSVTSIGKYAFYGCSSLTSITIPNSVTSIGKYAFKDCSSLTSISVDDVNPSYKSENGVLMSKDGTELLAYPAGNTATSYTIPYSVTTIGEDAFFRCSSLTSITIPNSVTSIGKYAFYGCSSLTSITIPNSVTSMGYGAFDECSNLTSITIPNSVTSIGEYAFFRCSSLTSITIPNSVTKIEIGAFSECNSLTSITISNSVTTIGEYAFFRCSSLTDVYCYAENVPTTYSYAFSYSNIDNATLHVPAASVDAYNSTAPWSGFKEIVALKDSDPNPTGIKTRGFQKPDEGSIYDLNGRRFEALQKGIIIMNGKKVLVK